jgi:glycine/D-amino acid oxidase-like deaminating enzyme
MTLAVVGNGILGTLSALELAKQNPSEKILLIGKLERPFSATNASGAMVAVFAEYDLKERVAKEFQDVLFKLSLESQYLWVKFIKENGINSVATSKSTVVYLKKNPSDFERENFDSVRAKAVEGDVYAELDGKKLESIFPVGVSHLEEVFNIQGEFSIDTQRLLSFLDSELSKYAVTKIDQDVSIINLETNQIVLKNRDTILYSRLVLAAGSNTSNILNPKCILPIFSAVGTAIIFKNEKFAAFDKNYVIRTVNRGGAQCGIHLVPREGNQFYLGAGSYISNQDFPSHRIETLRYLFQTFIEDIAGKDLAYESIGEITIGKRPKSLDGLPLIGELQEFRNVFVLSGNNRVGFTMAPKLVKILLGWSNGQQIDKNLNVFSPNRKPISLGSVQEGMNYLTQSRISNAVEHGMIPNTTNAQAQKSVEINNYVTNLVKKLSIKHPKVDLSTVDPDNWSLLSQNDYNF